MGYAGQEESCRVIDCGPIPVIYADAILEVMLTGGDNCRIVFCEYREYRGQTVRVPVLEMIRPIASVSVGLIVKMIEAKIAAKLH